ncbi:hypothetical protein GCM10011506_20200 [Marivirga lumbricoides]|nr:hypothetical protein GCM10011506_20200 [Marivirga lumbricoides]
MLYFTGCKDDDEGLDTGQQSCLITELNDDGDIIVFNNNSDGKTTSLEFSYYETDCNYNPSTEEFVCDSSLVQNEIKLVYTGQLITGAQFFEDGVATSIDLVLTYDDESKLSKLTYTDSYDEDIYVYEYRLEYNSADQVVKVEEYDTDNGSETLQLYGYEVYEYVQNRLNKVEYFYENSNNSMRKGKKRFNNRNKGVTQRIAPELSSTVSVTVDDKFNPFYKNVAFLLYNESFQFFVSENNFLTYEETEAGDSESSYSAVYEYEYNSKNFPTAFNVVFSENGVKSEEFTASISYECK